jgi:glucose/arabinose dehydrogenase
LRSKNRYLLPLGLLMIAACSGQVSPPTARSTTTTLIEAPPPSLPLTTTTAVVVATTTTVAPATTTTTEPLPELQGLALELVADDFHRPNLVVSPAGDKRLFVMEQYGYIVIIDPELGRLETPFLDLRPLVNAISIEQGLLGLAFHPDYASNGRFFVYYTQKDDNSVLFEFRASVDPNLADPTSGTQVMHFVQPTVRHNAGMLEFGPDGYLYLSLGEGGAAQVHAQDPNTHLASILRLDVNGAKPYAIPPSNPFADGIDGAPEVWAYGLRNPWRFSIDPETNSMYIGDVGHSNWEEVDILSLDEGGSNLGWVQVEGLHCFAFGCDLEAFTPPVLEYSHENGNCSITGGRVYRGSLIPELDGFYFYSDWCAGWLRSFVYSDGGVTSEIDWTEDVGEFGQPTSFGVDSSGELYITTWGGDIFRLVARR